MLGWLNTGSRVRNHTIYRMTKKIRKNEVFLDRCAVERGQADTEEGSRFIKKKKNSDNNVAWSRDISLIGSSLKEREQNYKKRKKRKIKRAGALSREREIGKKEGSEPGFVFTLQTDA